MCNKNVFKKIAFWGALLFVVSNGFELRAQDMPLEHKQETMVSLQEPVILEQPAPLEKAIDAPVQSQVVYPAKKKGSRLKAFYHNHAKKIWIVAGSAALGVIGYSLSSLANPVAKALVHNTPLPGNKLEEQDKIQADVVWHQCDTDLHDFALPGFDKETTPFAEQEEEICLIGIVGFPVGLLAITSYSFVKSAGVIKTLFKGIRFLNRGPVRANALGFAGAASLVNVWPYMPDASVLEDQLKKYPSLYSEYEKMTDHKLVKKTKKAISLLNVPGLIKSEHTQMKAAFVDYPESAWKKLIPLVTMLYSMSHIRVGPLRFGAYASGAIVYEFYPDLAQGMQSTYSTGKKIVDLVAD